MVSSVIYKETPTISKRPTCAFHISNPKQNSVRLFTVVVITGMVMMLGQNRIEGNFIVFI